MMFKKRKHSKNQTQASGAKAAGRETQGKTPKRTFWPVVGYVSATIGILLVVLKVGQYWGYREARKDEFKTFVEYLSEIKSKVQIKDISCDKNRLSPGDTCELTLTISNESPYECALWVGASAIAPDGQELWNAREDQIVTICPSGLTLVKRYLTLPVEAVSGYYDIQVNLWYGKVSDPTQSERVSSAALRKQVFVEKSEPAG